MKFSYKWNLKDGYSALNVEKHGLKVFSTFACGGGSTMGYKLAGFDVIGANDIDPQMAKVYRQNHSPKHYFLCPIGDLLTIDLPKELFELDILDGSPPCSTFSMVGSREKAFKKKKKFREGQAEQVLSDLFFDWIKLVDRLKPKVAIAENVKGMLLGNAKSYTKIIIKELNKIGFEVQLFLLNGATMGVPQKRERVFFVCKRKDLNLPKLVLDFKEKAIVFKYIDAGILLKHKELSPTIKKYWDLTEAGHLFSTAHPKGSFFSQIKLAFNKVCNTITAGARLYHPIQPRSLIKEEFALAGTFPIDYNYLDIKPEYLIGMSVPPVMAAQVAYQVYLQLLKTNG